MERETARRPGGDRGWGCAVGYLLFIHHLEEVKSFKYINFVRHLEGNSMGGQYSTAGSYAAGSMGGQFPRVPMPPPRAIKLN